MSEHTSTDTPARCQNDTNDKAQELTAFIDDETLARAILTFCIDSADALMFATIKGAGSASGVLNLLVEQPSSASNRQLDQAFATGTAQWGRKVNARGMNSFHNQVQRWKKRLQLLPSSDPEVLKQWLSADGTQWIIGPSSPYWPQNLNDLSIRKDWATPLCLWGIGDPSSLVSCCAPIAIVGSRGANDYGRYIAKTVAKKAAEQGHLVVSGGAFGIDAAAHAGALETVDHLGEHESGRTVAVFAGGLNHIGPERNRSLFNRITCGSGALISELCPDTIPEARRFLLRNRIIAAIASTVVVAQARSRSGALNTANWAAELGREVYAAPGDINVPDNTGCNWLIRDNRATILTSANRVEDICHTSHAPQSASMNSQTQDAENVANPDILAFSQQGNTQPSAASKVDYVNHSHLSPTSGIEPSKAQQEILTTIRRCGRNSITPTHETILAMLNESHSQHSQSGPSTGNTGKAPGDKAWNLTKLESELGEMELLGLITLQSGTIRITTSAHCDKSQGLSGKKS